MKTHLAMAPLYRKADHLLTVILLAMFVVSLTLSGIHDTLKWSFIIGLPTVAIATIAAFYAGGTRLSRMTITTAIMVMCALHIHQGNGRDELHFGIFVALAFLLCYRDWSVIIFAAGVAALHHFSFNYLQELGYGAICFQEPGLSIVFMHAGYVVAETAVLCYLASMLQKEALQSAELRASISSLRPDDKVIDLSPQAPAVSHSGQALREVLKMMSATIARVQNTVETTRAAATQIAEGSAQLFERTEEQNVAIHDALNAMSNLRESVLSNAEHSQHADRLASAASSVAQRGGQQVSSVVERMTVINESSRKISEITSVIDEIAFQTNILALNAAVEAARAGEQGRGFAVVASEVRNLAQRSGVAAREIKRLIDASVNEVDAGSVLAQEAGHTMQEIVASVSDVTSLIGEISKASTDQTNRVSSVCEAITAMDHATQHNSAMVKETAEAADSLREQAHSLTEVVSVFRLSPRDISSEKQRRLLSAYQR